MSVITPSDTALAYVAQLTMGQQRFDIAEASDVTGATAIRLGAPPRWTASIRTLDALEPDISGIWRAIVAELEGRINHFALYDLTQPAPRGTARGVLTLSSTAVAGATSLSIAGARGLNVILGGSFEVDSNADGLADGWVRLSAGSTGTLTASLDTDVAYIVHGTRSQFLRAAALAAGGGNLHGAYQAAVPVTHLAGQTVTAAVQVAGTAGTTLALYVTWQDSGGGSIAGSDIFASVTASGGVQQLSGSILCPANAATAYVEVRQSNGSGGVAAIYVDALRLVAGSTAPTYPAAPTLLAGDWLQVGTGVGSHLCMVTTDTTLSDAGAGSVPIKSATRKSHASGTAVAWDKPRGHFKLRPDAVSWSGIAGATGSGGFALDLIEDWTA